MGGEDVDNMTRAPQIQRGKKKTESQTSAIEECSDTGNMSEDLGGAVLGGF